MKRKTLTQKNCDGRTHDVTLVTVGQLGFRRLRRHRHYDGKIDEKTRKTDDARQTYSSFNFLFSRTHTKKLNKGKKIDNKNKV